MSEKTPLLRIYRMAAIALLTAGLFFLTRAGGFIGLAALLMYIAAIYLKSINNTKEDEAEILDNIVVEIIKIHYIENERPTVDLLSSRGWRRPDIAEGKAYLRSIGILKRNNDFPYTYQQAMTALKEKAQ